MNYYYFDASAWVKRYYKEPGTDQIQDLFDSGSPRACATLGLVEVIATLSRKRKAGQLNEKDFLEKIQEVERDWSEFLQIEFSAEIVAQAKDSAQRFALRGADAIHMASALVLQVELGEDEELVLVTSDQDLKTAARISGMQVLDPAEQPDKSK